VAQFFSDSVHIARLLPEADNMLTINASSQ